MSVTVRFRCHGCGTSVDAAHTLPFRCPNSAATDDIDHVLVAEQFEAGLFGIAEQNPFLRYRSLLSPYRLARASGLSDASWGDIVGELQEALVAVDARGFQITPFAQQPSLAKAVNVPTPLWVKDETHNVGGSHKARHLMGVLLYLRVLEVAKLPAGEGLRTRRLAIASCGNAALAAAVLARAAHWPLDVFIPVDASTGVRRKLTKLGASVTACERSPDEAGDPCVLRFREAVARGAIPFGVQGNENGLAVEGARTLAFEMAETLSTAGETIETLFVQVGGGALASALAQGFGLAVQIGFLKQAPKLMAVQTEACAPLARAWSKLEGVDVTQAALHRSRYMWPWHNLGRSLADGILDDETYDWWAVSEAMRATGGRPVVVNEAAVASAQHLAGLHTGIPASATGTAGLAGALTVLANGSMAVIFSGMERGL
jgi:threonine synthase